jgi:hypothetical protein
MRGTGRSVSKCPWITCPSCKLHGAWSTWSYSERYDTIYCEPCDIWLETACKDPACWFCAERPEKPN